MDPERRRRLRAAQRKLAEAKAERDAAIREAREAGDPLREIAAEVGLTHAGVKKIADRE